MEQRSRYPSIEKPENKSQKRQKVRQLTKKNLLFLMLLLEILAIIIIIAACVLYAIVITNIVDFQIDRINPIDISSTLNKYIKPLMATHGILVLLFIFDIFSYGFSFFFQLLIHFLILGYFFKKTKNHKPYFEPLTIVRDSNTHKYTFMGFLVLTAVSFIYQLVMLIVILLTKK